MQYILSEEEYKELINYKLAHINSRMPHEEDLQKMCTKIAEEWASWSGWKGDEEPRPWGCILAVEMEQHYCDECPVQTICPNPNKEWSK